MSMILPLHVQCMTYTPLLGILLFQGPGPLGPLGPWVGVWGDSEDSTKGVPARRVAEGAGSRSAAKAQIWQTGSGSEENLGGFI